MVVTFTPGENAGYGDLELPEVVLGAPQGGGPNAGGLDVLSLGKSGTIVLELGDIVLVDEPGVDLLVFENPFPGWLELGVVAVSEDGETWHEWPCDVANEEELFPGCAGVNPVLSNQENGIDPTDVDQAGGDGFDLADLGLTEACFVRITDAGDNAYEGTSGDLT